MKRPRLYHWPHTDWVPSTKALKTMTCTPKLFTCHERSMDNTTNMTLDVTSANNKTTSRELAHLAKPLTRTNFEGRIDTRWTNPYLRQLV